MIDLHCHSTASDGTYSPTEIIQLAKEIKLSAIALTDHDTSAGIKEFLQAAQGEDLLAIPGIELACRNEQEESFHILGLFIDAENTTLEALTEQILQWRNERNLKIISILNENGIELSLSEVLECCEGEVLGRPHIAKALMQKNHCRDIKDAFTSILGRGCSGYVARQVPSPAECIAAIHSAGGVAFWAHPFTRKNINAAECRRLATYLKTEGIDGIEAYYSLHKKAQTEKILEIAEDLNLLVSGGSDFHGSHFPKLQLGSGFGRLRVPDQLIEPIQEKAEKYAKSNH